MSRDSETVSKNMRKQSPVNKTQNILKVIFYSKGSSVSSLIFTNPSLSF